VKELVILSGKGGTGKTSVAASFAALAGNSVLADCDVDAADLHLVLDPAVRHSSEFRSGKEAVIRQEDCMGCGMCHSVCEFSAIEATDNPDGSTTFSVDPFACEGCGLCVRFCPEQAIDFPETVSGEWFVSETRFGPFVHARLGIAAENSGKLVSLVRAEAKKLAKQQNIELMLTDGPPGIGCPVIASVTGADAVLIVTEPTVSGLHDLERIVRLTEFFRVRAMVCVNKCDINRAVTGQIRDFCGEHELEYAGEIPWDAGVTKAQLAGIPVVEHNSSAAAGAIRDTWDRARSFLTRS
jgi:MinD superfamily P-loop ATPase